MSTMSSNLQCQHHQKETPNGIQVWTKVIVLRCFGADINQPFIAYSLDVGSIFQETASHPRYPNGGYTPKPKPPMALAPTECLGKNVSSMALIALNGWQIPFGIMAGKSSCFTSFTYTCSELIEVSLWNSLAHKILQPQLMLWLCWVAVMWMLEKTYPQTLRLVLRRYCSYTKGHIHGA